MVPHSAGAIVLVRFPFSDLSKTKLRPAVVLADVGRGDLILCQVTSKSYGDIRAVEFGSTDFAKGSLRVTSYARPGKLFTIATPILGGMVTSTIHVLIITPVIFYIMKRRALRRGTLQASGMTA